MKKTFNAKCPDKNVERGRRRSISNQPVEVLDTTNHAHETKKFKEHVKNSANQTMDGRKLAEEL